MRKRKVVLHAGKERAVVQNRHPWIFSGAVKTFPKDLEPGEIAAIYSADGEFLGKGYFNMENSLCGRILSFEDIPVEEILRQKIKLAYELRLSLLDLEKTNAFRLVNAEEDGLPGLVIDLYGKTAVMQINTQGMERLRPMLVEALQKEVKLSSIYEKSLSSARSLEGLAPEEGFLFGEENTELTMQENGILFNVSIKDGQKTGFFLDQREMRKKIGSLSKEKSVLNCFSYSGGFSMYALQGGAKSAKSVDVCEKAITLSEKNSTLNGFTNHSGIVADVFRFLEEEDLSSYDIIILDPPAFAKKKADIKTATEGYRKLFAKVFAKCKPGTLLLACSCSYYIDAALFKQTLFKGAAPSGRSVRILSGHLQGADHPVSLFHPEGDYLKSFLVHIG